MTEHTQIIVFSNNFSISFETRGIIEYAELEGTCQDYLVPTPGPEEDKS